MRTIDGMELEKALLKSQGMTWDSIPIPKVTADDLRQDAIDLFKEKAVSRGRLTTEDVKSSNNVLMENLRLYENDNLIRAAVMTFHKDPERWVHGAYIKNRIFCDGL